MTHAGGRPRKTREEDYCLCCGNKGYKRLVRAWTPKYKETTIGAYYRFRHDDRQFICPKCHTQECYVNRLIKDVEAKTMPADNIIKQLRLYEKRAVSFRKFLFKQMSVFQTWPLDERENKRVYDAVKIATHLEACYLATIDLVSSISALYYILELKIKFGRSLAAEAQMPEIINDIDYDIEIIGRFESESKNQTIGSFLEPLSQLISELDRKFGIDQRKEQKKAMISKLRDRYNYPKRTLAEDLT